MAKKSYNKKHSVKKKMTFCMPLAKLRKRRKVGSGRFRLKVFVLEVRSVSSCPASVCLIIQLREYSCAGEFRARHTWRTTDLRWFNISTAGELSFMDFIDYYIKETCYIKTLNFFYFRLKLFSKRSVQVKDFVAGMFFRYRPYSK